MSKKRRSSPSRVLGSKGSLNDPAPSVSLGQGGEPREKNYRNLLEGGGKERLSIDLSVHGYDS